MILRSSIIYSNFAKDSHCCNAWNFQVGFSLAFVIHESANPHIGKMSLCSICLSWFSEWYILLITFQIHMLGSCLGASSRDHCVQKHEAVSRGIHLQWDCDCSNRCSHIFCQHKLHQGEVKKTFGSDLPCLI